MHDDIFHDCSGKLRKCVAPAPKQFYLVWDPDELGTCGSFTTEQNATLHAEKMAKNSPGKRFYVVVTLSFTVASETKTTKLV